MAIKEAINTICYRHVFPPLGLLAARLISRTYRYRWVGREVERDVLKAHGSVVYASWHQRFFPGITLFASRKPIAIIISQSRDGEMIARVADMLGWRSVRGSSTRGGMRAMKEIRALSIQGYRFGHIVDGPQGPFGVIKPGLITIAQFVGAPILPVIISAERYWLASSWDRFMIPKPFSRVGVRFAAPINVSRRLDATAFETLRQAVQDRIKDLYDQTDNWWRDPTIIDHNSI